MVGMVEVLSAVAAVLTVAFAVVARLWWRRGKPFPEP